MKIEGNTFFVTGGASGLGEGVCRLFTKLGGNVIIGDLNVDGGRALESELGNQALFCKVNVTSEDSVKAAVEAGVKKFGGLQGVVNCAGVANARRVLSGSGKVCPFDSFKKVVDINLNGTFNALRLGAKAMISTNQDAKEKGVIINVASVAAFDGQIGQAAYSASKAGVAGMTLPIARDLSKWGIRICTIAPGMFATAMTKKFPEPLYQSLASQVQYPKRFGTPAEFAQCCQFITENEYMNGEVIRLDGGIRMGPK